MGWVMTEQRPCAGILGAPIGYLVETNTTFTIDPRYRYESLSPDNQEPVYMFQKLARTLTSVLPIDSSRSGECCKLPFRCVFLKSGEDGKNFCSVYKVRPLNCRKFPRTSAQIKPVQHVCGFSFENTTEVSVKDIYVSRSAK